MTFKLDDSYVDVAARLQQFYEKHPEGRITRLDDPRVMEVGGKTFIVYSAVAYRAPDDPLPCVGTAWEPFPGTTPYTKDSELMNAETAAWGRAIIAAGIPSKKVASADEVAARGSGDSRDAPSEKQVGFLRNILQGKARGKPQPTKAQLEVLAQRVSPPIVIEEGWIGKLDRAQCSTLLDLLNGPLPDTEHPSDVPSDGFPPVDWSAPAETLGLEEAA